MNIDDMVVSHRPCGWTGRAEDMFNPSKHKCADEMNKKLLEGVFHDKTQNKRHSTRRFRQKR